MGDVLSRELVDDALNRLPHWSTDGTSLTREVSLSDSQHEQVAARVDEVQTAMDHHADTTRDGDTTRFVLSTHSEGGITVKDLTLASEIDSAVRAQTGEEPQRPPEDALAEHNNVSEQDQQAVGEASRERTAAVVTQIQGSEGKTGEAASEGTDGVKEKVDRGEHHTDDAAATSSVAGFADGTTEVPQGGGRHRATEADGEQ